MIPFNVDFDITVIGGIGSTLFGKLLNISLPTYGVLRVLVVTPPLISTVYEYILYSTTGKALAGSPGTMTGESSVLEIIPLAGGGSVSVLNAPDGTYHVQLVVDGAGVP